MCADGDGSDDGSDDGSQRRILVPFAAAAAAVCSAVLVASSPGASSSSPSSSSAFIVCLLYRTRVLSLCNSRTERCLPATHCRNGCFYCAACAVVQPAPTTTTTPQSGLIGNGNSVLFWSVLFSFALDSSRLAAVCVCLNSGDFCFCPFVYTFEHFQVCTGAAVVVVPPFFT